MLRERHELDCTSKMVLSDHRLSFCVPRVSLYRCVRAVGVCRGVTLLSWDRTQKGVHVSLYALPLLYTVQRLLHPCGGCELRPLIWVVESQPPQEVSLSCVHGHVGSLKLLNAALQLVHAVLVRWRCRRCKQAALYLSSFCSIKLRLGALLLWRRSINGLQRLELSGSGTRNDMLLPRSAA